MARQLRSLVTSGRGLRVGAATVAFLGALSAPSVALKTPAVVRSASLAQRGRSLRWTVALEGPLSSRRLRERGRALCLLMERRRSRAVFAKLCIAPPRHRREGARLMFFEVSGATVGHARRIRARVKRPRPNVLEASFTPGALGIGYRALRWQVQSSVEPPACAPAGESEEGGSAGSGQSAGVSEVSRGVGDAPSGESGGCSTLYPSRPTLLRLHKPKLVGCVPRGPSLVFGGPTNVHEIALTFDDGPWNDPPTMDFVNLLARYSVPATFFEIGEEIPTYDPTGAIGRRMIADGDMLAVHTWTHPNMTSLSPSQQRSQIEMTSRAIRERTGFTPCLWRPPYGDTSGQLESLARSLGFLTVLWNIDPRDWSLPGVGAIEANVLTNARNGGIVIMHFGGGPRGQTLSALPNIITTLRKRGYKFVTVAKMLKLRMIYR